MSTSHRHAPGAGGDGHQRPHLHRDHDHEQAQVLDFDAEVLEAHTAAITAWLPVRSAPTEIVDLGAGTGAGTLALLRQFPQAHVTAVDSSAAHLAQLEAKARAVDLTDRLSVLQVDLDAAEWPDLGAPELVWASASMHHLTDPVTTARRIRDLLAPGGLVAIIELAGLPRFLPPTAPEDRPGLEERYHAATQRLLAEHLPHRGADWGPKLVAAGFDVEDTLSVDVNVPAMKENAVRNYALAVLRGLRKSAADLVSAEDLTALDRLLDPTAAQSILRRHDLAVRTTRTVWAARSGEARRTG